MRVDLPAPFCPKSARISPGKRSRSTASTAIVPPKAFVIPRSESTGPAVGLKTLCPAFAVPIPCFLAIDMVLQVASSYYLWSGRMAYSRKKDNHFLKSIDTLFGRVGRPPQSSRVHSRRPSLHLSSGKGNYAASGVPRTGDL